MVYKNFTSLVACIYFWLFLQKRYKLIMKNNAKWAAKRGLIGGDFEPGEEGFEFLEGHLVPSEVVFF